MASRYMCVLNRRMSYSVPLHSGFVRRPHVVTIGQFVSAKIAVLCGVVSAQREEALLSRRALINGPPSARPHASARCQGDAVCV